MRWAACVVALTAALSCVSVGAQDAFPTKITVEPQRVTVGDRINLVITVEHDSDITVEAPSDPEAFQPLDLIELREPVTRDAGDGWHETVFAYELAAFLIGDVELEPISITSGGATVARVQPDAIVVESVVPPDAAVEFRDLKPPLQASTGPPKWIWAALTMAGFAAVSIFTMALARVPTLSEPAAPLPAPSEPPPEDAEYAVLEELAAIEDAGLLEKGELVEHYRRLGESLRRYLARRSGVPVMAMTPHEIEARLDATSMNKLAIRQAVSTLEQCQAVQFAGYEPAPERAEADLEAVREVVRLTSDDAAEVEDA